MKIPVTSNPRYSAPPLMKWDPEHPENFQAHCGSSFILAGDSPEGLIVTAAHVVSDWGLDEPNTSAIAVEVEGQENLTMIPVLDWVLDVNQDIAVGFIKTDVPLTGFEFYSGSTWAYNLDVATIEHSGSVRKNPHSGGSSHYQPGFRTGHIVRTGDNLHPSYPDVTMHELSFPALKGASGSPIFAASAGFGIVGVTSANIERELMPAQLLTAFNEDGSKVEETRYFLPNGLAVNYTYLKKFVEDSKKCRWE